MEPQDALLIGGGLLATACGLFAIASAIRDAGKWIADAIWHPSYMDPPRKR